MAHGLQSGLRDGGLSRGGLHAGLGNGSIFNIASLDLNFAKYKNIGSLVTFTRASSGTFVGSDGVLRTAATNEPRFDHNPTTGGSLGLLAEEARTNLQLRSEEFDNTGTWSRTGLSTVTANTAVAPDGSTTADALVEDASTSNHRVFSTTSSLAASTSYSLSVYVKASTRTIVRVEVRDSVGAFAAQDFNLITQAITSAGSGTGAITALGNGWFRCTVTGTTSVSGGVGVVLVYSMQVVGNATYTGTNGTSAILLWGAQLEAGAFATSYTPTTTASVTRAADVASITGSNFSSWYNQTEGTVFASGDFVALGATSFSRIVGLAGANTGIDEISFYTRVAVGSGNGTIFGAVIVNSSLEGDLNGPSGYPNLSGGYRSAIAYKANNFGLSSNGLTPTTDTSGTLPTITQLIIMGSLRFQNRLSGHVRRLTYWPTRLSNTTLQSITK